MQESRKLTKNGIVVSDKMDKTIVVLVERQFTHPLYKKTVRVHNKFMAHDEKNEAQIGDKVIIEEFRPLSRNKRWNLRQITEKVK